MKNSTPKKKAASRKPSIRTPKAAATAAFYIVGIGASAGGLEALEQFFSHMRPDSGMGFVVIQHLDPHHKGILCELLQRVTTMKVVTATDRAIVHANAVYIIPPNKSMSILNGTLHLFDPVEARGLHLPIDLFFRSLADDKADKSVGIILSGMGSDGSLGLRSIKERAGIALVQDPHAAKFDSMPQSALEAVMADIVAPAEELPQKLIDFLEQPSQRSSKMHESEKNTGALEKIILLLRTRSGHDFSLYKKTTLYRRIERRMSVHQIRKIAAYVRYLQENPAESEILFKELLIGVTNFFRDPFIWDYLRDTVFPSMIAKAEDGTTLRAWVPACSTGEEAYSLAIVFKEAMENVKPNKTLSLLIFATDLDSTAIEKARKGVYLTNITADVSPKRLNRFFVKAEHQYRLSAEIREMLVFAPQNVIKDPPFTKLDILACRNLMIYLESELQKKLLSLFHYSLKPDGVLFLGSAETIGSQDALFQPIEPKFRIYECRPREKNTGFTDFPATTVEGYHHVGEIPSAQASGINVQALTDRLLLQKFSPPGILVTEKGDIIYLTGETEKYLTIPPGRANWNLFAMAREGLRSALPAVLRKAALSYEKISLQNVVIAGAAGELHTDVTIQQIDKPSSLQGKILLVFNDRTPMKRSTSNLKKNPKSEKGASHGASTRENQRLKSELQSTREEMQTSQEELKSMNEELQSTNEELQSTNEELTTSKEEMQSLNEELHTVNTELQSKVDDLARVNNDMTNLLNSTEIATLFLDKELKIRQFTISTTRIFKLIQSDIGRLFTDQVTKLDYPDIYDDAKEVLRTLTYCEKTVPARDTQWFTIRIMPYRTMDDKIDGVVMTFIDVTKAKTLENSMRESGALLRSLINMVPSVILALSPDGKIIECNPEAERVFFCKREDVIGKRYVDLFIPESERKKTEEEMKGLLNGALPHHYQNIVRTAKGHEFRIGWTAHKLLDVQGISIGIITIGEKMNMP
ncbi:MAG TPA: chemotaxis protein CheB [Bacteroidota bacterium]|nr:chemotaxis protein CheB [Bacteroidota bacterium]